MNRVAVDLGFIKIYVYSICVFLGIITASFIIYKESKKNKLDTDELFDLLFYTLLIGILGARVYYVLFNLDYYLANPKEIIAIWNGGLAIHGGIITGLLVVLVYCKKKNINTLKMLDIGVVGVIGVSYYNQEDIKRIAEYVNNEMEGINQKSPFGNRMHIAIIGCMNITEKLFAVQAENDALKEQIRQFELDKEDLGSDIKKTEAQIMSVEKEKSELMKEKDALAQELNDKNDLLNQYREHLKQAKTENDSNRKSILELQNKLFETQIELSKSQENTISK